MYQNELDQHPLALQLIADLKEARKIIICFLNGKRMGVLNSIENCPKQHPIEDRGQPSDFYVLRFMAGYGSDIFIRGTIERAELKKDASGVFGFYIEERV